MNSEEPNKLFEEAIEDGREYLPRLRNGLSEVALLLQEGREGEGISLFIDSIEGLEWFGSVLAAAACFNVAMVADNDHENLAVRYRHILADLLGAWENRDMVLIGDLLEFEIVPIIETFMDRMVQVQEN
jgi:hypothetical protein